MEAEIRALTAEVRNLVAILAQAQSQQRIDSITSRHTEESMSTKLWNESRPLIRESFESWRDYLYKYALVLISILGFLVTLIATKWIGQLSVPMVTIGIVCITVSILITFLSIFITLYLERLFIDADLEFTRSVDVGFHRADGVDDPLRNPMRAIEKHLASVIATREQELAALRERCATEQLSDAAAEQLEGEIADLDSGIKKDKRSKGLMKYVGVRYSSYETARLYITLGIVILSLIGISTIVYTLLDSYASTSGYILRQDMKPAEHILMPIK